MRSALARLHERACTQQWFLAARDCSPAHHAYLSVMDYCRLPQPRDEFRADPFLLEDGDDTWVFFESYWFGDGKGHIAAGRLQRSPHGAFHLCDVQPVLTRPYHLSFPCILRADGELWMIPETTARRTVELYRCRTFPHVWELHRILLRDIDVADATLFHHEDHWWLLAAHPVRSRDTGIAHQLCIFFAAGIEGPWLAHPLNPLRSSPAGTRSAGNVFLEEKADTHNRLLWPTQDCGTRYGGAIHFRELLHLTPISFHDAAAGSLHPAPPHDWKGLHTYQRSSRFEIVDGLDLSVQLDLKLAGLVGKAKRHFRCDGSSC